MSLAIDLIGKALFSVAGQQMKKINQEVIGGLLYGRSNLRVVHCGSCHQTTDRPVEMTVLESLITA